MMRRSLLFALPLGTFLLCLMAVTVNLLAPSYLGMELFSSGVVHDTDPSGPALRAGVQVGDEIRAVDGRRLHTLTSLARGKSPGEAVVLSIRRQGELVDVSVTLGRVTEREQVFRLERLFVGLMFWIVGLGGWLLRRQNRAARLFFVFSQVTAGMLFAEILDPGIPAMSILTDFSRYLVAPLFLHFAATFPEPIPDPLRGHLLRAVYAGYGVLALVMAGALLVWPHSHPQGLWLTPRVFEVLVGVLALGALLKPHPTASLDAHRRRRVLLAGMLLGITPVMITLVGRVLGGPLIAYEWTVPALAFVPVAYGYAVYKGELGQTDLILNRSMVYILLTVFLLGVYALLYFSFDFIFSAERGWGHLVSGVVLVLIGSPLFVPLRTRLQHGVDRLFYGGWYDYRTFVQTVSADLGRFTDLAELTSQLKTAAERMRFEAGTLLWLRGETFCPMGSFGFERSILPLMRLPVGARIPGVLHRDGRVYSQAELRDALATADLSSEESTLLRATEIKYWIPLVCRGTLRSILVAGPRLGEIDLDPEDRAILSTLSTQAAIACENIALLESLTDRLTEVEQVRDELTEAQTKLAEGRENERLHLARELHDGPVQDLYALLHETESLAEEDGESSLSSRVAPLREGMQRVAVTLRDICVELRPPLLPDFGLDVTIESHVMRFRKKHAHVEIELELTPHGESLPERVQLGLFRICQEALNNAVQHGNARSIRVRFEADAERILLEVADDGGGFDVPERWITFGRRGHLGLLGIAERVEALGGTLDIVSHPGAGTTLRVEAPCPQEASHDETVTD